MYLTNDDKLMKKILIKLFVCTISTLAIAAEPTDIIVKPKDSASKNPLKSHTYQGTTLNYSAAIPLNEVKPTQVRTKKAVDYFNQYIDPQPIDVAINIFTQPDWNNHTSVRPYGMPHIASKKDLNMAFENNPLWQSTIPPKGSIATTEMKRFIAVYGDQNGNISMKPFFDFLAIHELGHLVAIQSNVNFSAHWLNEFYANLLLHGYVATVEPENLDILTLSPNVNTQLLSPKYKTLEEFEKHYYQGMDPINYVWFQARFHQVAHQVFDQLGNEGIAKLFKQFKNAPEMKSVAETIDYIEKNVDPKLAAAFRNF